MGHKKRNTGPRSKPSQPSPAAAAADSVDCEASNPEQSLTTLVAKSQAELADYASIKIECERALRALRRGNHTKALRLMKDLCSKHDNSPYSAFVNRVQGTVCFKVASIIDDPNVKQRHLNNAIQSARKAVSLSPNSIEFAHFYANLLYEAANDPEEYEEVVPECMRGLMIQNPVDPAKESLPEENQHKFATADARVSHVQSELRSLMHKANVASISAWMRKLKYAVEDKFPVDSDHKGP